MSKPLYAILLDGEFVRQKLYQQINAAVQEGEQRTPVKADHVETFASQIMALDEVNSYELLRVYYYDSKPLSGTVKQPVSGEVIELTKTPRYRHSMSLLDKLAHTKNFAVRLGHIGKMPYSWRMKPKKIKALIRGVLDLQDADFRMDITQKGVDMRIGLDIARLTLREVVRCIVVVTSDSDFISAFKFARREGVRVVLVTMGHGIHSELREHVDVVIDAPGLI